MKLLTAAASNAKTAKNEQFSQFLTFILHLAPYKLSGVNLCPMASRGCAASCLNSAGRGRFKSVQAGRLRKSKLFLENRAEFFKQLRSDLDAVVRKALREGKTPVVRLNGTSDIQWELIKIEGALNVFELYPMIQFYDYTKIIKRLERALPSNYHLTFSRAEDNDAAVNRALELGFNVAAVFAEIEGLAEFEGRPVIDGDSHDLRFLEGKQGAWVALKAKGDAKRDTSGFVLNTNKPAKLAA